MTESAVELTKPMIAVKRQTISVTLLDEPIVLFVDSLRIVQVFANLLNNAAKFSGDGGRICLATERAEHDVIVRIRGIAEAQSPGPCLEASSSFVFLSMPQRSAPRTERSNVAAIGAAPSRPRRVLIVDDHVADANGLVAVLRLFRHDVKVCFDGFAALAAAGTFHPEVVLTDIGLPRMSGIEFAAQLRRKPGFEHTLLIAVKGYGKPGVGTKARATGFDHYLVKPVDLN